MKKFIFLGSILLVFSGCTPSTLNTSPTKPLPPPIVQTTPTTPLTPNTPIKNVCSEGQYSCACATGNYCLRMGAMCLSPSTPCPTTTPTAPKPIPTPTPPKSLTYKSSQYNFQFNYPPTFASTDANYGNLENKIVQIQLPSTAYPKTNFDDAAFTVSESTAKSLNACLTMTLPEGVSEFKDSKTINSQKFYTSNGSGAGAGNLYEGKVYRTLIASQCFEIVETIHTSNIGNFDPGTVTEINKTPIWTTLDSILSAFTFTI